MRPVSAALLCALLATGVAASPALARVRGLTGRVVMLDGYWEADASAEAAAQPEPSADTASKSKPSVGVGAGADVRMRLSLATLPDGRGIRVLAVTAMRAYFDADSSVEPWRRGGIRPAINLRGREEVIARMLAVPEGKPMTVVASWTEGSADLLVADVRFDEESEDGLPEPR